MTMQRMGWVRSVLALRGGMLLALVALAFGASVNADTVTRTLPVPSGDAGYMRFDIEYAPATTDRSVMVSFTGVGGNPIGGQVVELSNTSATLSLAPPASMFPAFAATGSVTTIPLSTGPVAKYLLRLTTNMSRTVAADVVIAASEGTVRVIGRVASDSFEYAATEKSQRIGDTVILTARPRKANLFPSSEYVSTRHEVLGDIIRASAGTGGTLHFHGMVIGDVGQVQLLGDGGAALASVPFNSRERRHFSISTPMPAANADGPLESVGVELQGAVDDLTLIVHASDGTSVKAAKWKLYDQSRSESCAIQSGRSGMPWLLIVVSLTAIGLATIARIRRRTLGRNASVVGVVLAAIILAQTGRADTIREVYSGTSFSGALRFDVTFAPGDTERLVTLEMAARPFQVTLWSLSGYRLHELSALGGARLGDTSASGATTELQGDLILAASRQCLTTSGTTELLLLPTEIAVENVEVELVITTSSGTIGPRVLPTGSTTLSQTFSPTTTVPAQLWTFPDLVFLLLPPSLDDGRSEYFTNLKVTIGLPAGGLGGQMALAMTGALTARSTSGNAIIQVEREDWQAPYSEIATIPMSGIGGSSDLGKLLYLELIPPDALTIALEGNVANVSVLLRTNGAEVATPSFTADYFAPRYYPKGGGKFIGIMLPGDDGERFWFVMAMVVLTVAAVIGRAVWRAERRAG